MNLVSDSFWCSWQKLQNQLENKNTNSFSLQQIIFFTKIVCLFFIYLKVHIKNLTPNIPSPFSHANGPFSKRLLNTIPFPSILLLAIKHFILRHSALRAFLTPTPLTPKKKTFPHSFESCSSLSRILHRVPPKL